MKRNNKITTTLLFTLLLTLMVATLNSSLATSNLPSINSTNLPPPSQLPPFLNMTQQDKIQENNVLQFLSTVFELNTGSYNVTVLNTTPAPFGNFVTLDFNSSTNTFQAATELNYNQLVWCIIEPMKGSPAFTTAPASDALTTAENALGKIQSVSPQSYLTSIQSMLQASGLTNASTSTSNFAQSIITKQNEVTASWQPAANNLSNQEDKLILDFQNGRLMEYSNFLNLYTIGNTAVNVSQQQAIQIATADAEAFAWQAGNITVSNATVLENQAIANLTLQNRGNATLYPLWNILLPLDQLYPGGVTSFRVLIWADNGQVSSITPVGSYGIGDAPSPTPAASTSSQAVSTSTIAIIIAIVTAAIAISGYLFYKQKR